MTYQLTFTIAMSKILLIFNCYFIENKFCNNQVHFDKSKYQRTVQKAVSTISDLKGRNSNLNKDYSSQNKKKKSRIHYNTFIS